MLVPSKFCALFSFGSIVIMMAMATMMGTTNFLKKIYSKWNLPYALAYTISLVLGIYYSTNGGSYLVVLGLCIFRPRE